MTLSTIAARNLVAAGRKQREWTEKRDALIVQAVSNGASLREVAEAVGLSHTAIASIVKRDGDFAAGIEEMRRRNREVIERVGRESQTD